jgi:hypothetical protein
MDLDFASGRCVNAFSRDPVSSDAVPLYRFDWINLDGLIEEIVG